MNPSPTAILEGILRWTLRGCLGAVALSLGAACSSDLGSCNPPVPPGAQYKVTVVRETDSSDKCHIANLNSSFTITANNEEPAAGTSSCTMTPAYWAPTQSGMRVVRCQPSGTHMLGTECEMEYPSSCEGLVKFYFFAPAGVQVDWSAQRIENVVFRVEDQVINCIPNLARCIDEYQVILERQ